MIFFKGSKSKIIKKKISEGGGGDYKESKSKNFFFLLEGGWVGLEYRVSEFSLQRIRGGDFFVSGWGGVGLE